MPSLPSGWRRHDDFHDGLAIGIPPRWSVGHRRGALLVTSPDRLVAVSVTATRTGNAVTLPLDRFARAVLRALHGYQRPLRASAAGRLGGTPLRGFRASAAGVARNGIHERVDAIALRRDHVATFTVVVAASRGAPASESRQARALARTLRDRPVHQPAGGRSGRSG